LIDYHDINVGAVFRSPIDEEFEACDKLIVILSKHSMASAGMEHLVLDAFVREDRQNRLILLPLKLDNAVMKAPQVWADICRSRQICDFTRWKDSQAYQKAFNDLLLGLKVET